MRVKTLFFSALLALPAAGGAKNLTPAHDAIDAVTVFLDRAEITRQIRAELPKGSHTLTIGKLPAQLIEPSLRVGGEGPQGLRIGSVELRRVFGEKAAQEKERELRRQLTELQEQKAQLEARRQALDTQAKFIERLASLPDEKDAHGNRVFAPEKWPTAWQAIGKGMEETNLGRVALQQETRELNDKIRKVENELRQIQTGRRDTLNAMIHLEATHPGKAVLQLSYQLPGANWVPLYDARLDSDKGEVALIRSAIIRQSTGEAWKNVRLTVSTARPSAGARMPELHPWWIDFTRPITLHEAPVKLEKQAPLADEMFAGAPETAPAERVGAELQTSEFSVRYRIPGRINVAADNSRHRFQLGRAHYPVRLSGRAAPKFDPRAFLYAHLDYSDDTPLLAGQWQLQRDGVYVGTIRQQTIRPGDTLDLAFGPDDAIELDYKLLKDESGKQGLLNREKRVERNTRISITSGHKRSLPFTLYDQIPAPRNEAIKVELIRGSTPPSRESVDDKPGVLAWDMELQTGKKQIIDFGYRISYPQDESVPGF